MVCRKGRTRQLSDFSEKRAYAQGFSGKSLWIWFFHRKELMSMVFTKKKSLEKKGVRYGI
jgi:hypothetical protein